MPGAAEQIVRDRVGGSVVSGDAGREESQLVASSWVSVGVLRGVDARLVSGPVKLGCARTARQRRPQRSRRAAGALESVWIVLTPRVRAPCAPDGSQGAGAPVAAEV